MTTTKQPPPYMSFGVLQTATETLASTTVPHGPIDRRVLDGMSGADYGALISGLRFLGLVDENRTATPTYHALVKAQKEGEAKFKPALKQIIEESYALCMGNVDVAHGTIAQVEKAFKDAGVSQGQMLTKTIRFYVKALAYVGVSVSQHITKAKASKPSTSNNGDGKPRHKTKKTTKPSDTPAPEDKIGTGVERLPIPGLINAYIQYPSSLTEANCDLFEGMVGVLRTYVKGRKEKKP